jgi:diphthamide synthase (EF-2-diphthine--ammonia ligase)
MGEQMEAYRARGIFTVGFGDLFLADLRAWREANLARAEMRGVFPLWLRDTATLAREVIALGFRAYLSCVEGKVGPGFAGRAFDQSLLDELPPGIDPCGENGEFHSFVYDGPIFEKPVTVTVGETVIRDGRFYADLLPQTLPAEARAASAMPPV